MAGTWRQALADQIIGDGPGYNFEDDFIRLLIDKEQCARFTIGNFDRTFKNLVEQPGQF